MSSPRQFANGRGGDAAQNGAYPQRRSQEWERKYATKATPEEEQRARNNPDALPRRSKEDAEKAYADRMANAWKER